MMRRSLLVVWLVVCVLMVAGGARAQVLWSLSLTDPDQTAPPGATLVYDGVLANFAGVDLPGIFVVSAYTQHVDAFDFDPGFLAAYHNAGNALPAAGYAGPLFYLTWGAAAPPGYSFTASFGGTAGLPGGASESHSQEYIARVAAVPEPSAALVGAVGLVAGMGLLLRRRRA